MQKRNWVSAAGVLFLTCGCGYTQVTPLKSCDLAAPWGVIDSNDVAAVVNMTLGIAPCTVNIIGPGICNADVVERVVNASLSGICDTGSGTVAHSVTLNWTSSASSNLTNYKIYRGGVSGGPYTPLATLGLVTTYTDNNVQAGQTYYYVATAVNSSGQESAYSTEASAAVPNN
jgi:hypothetical protein